MTMIFAWVAALGIPALYDRLVRRWERFWTSEQKCPCCLFGKVQRLSLNMRECQNPKCQAWLIVFGRMNNQVPTLRQLFEHVKFYLSGKDNREADPPPKQGREVDWSGFLWLILFAFAFFILWGTTESLFFRE